MSDKLLLGSDHTTAVTLRETQAHFPDFYDVLGDWNSAMGSLQYSIGKTWIATASGTAWKVGLGTSHLGMNLTALYPTRAMKVYDVLSSRAYPGFYGSYPANAQLYWLTQERSYSWEDRLAALRALPMLPSGERENFEPNRMPTPWALNIAQSLSTLAALEMARLSTFIPTVLASLPDGAIHMEWTVRGATRHHLEVAIPGDANSPYQLL